MIFSRLTARMGVCGGCSIGWVIIIYRSDERVLPTIHKEGALPEPSVRELLSRSNIKFKTTFKNCVYDGFVGREWKQTWE
jgi:hypothetical protein